MTDGYLTVVLTVNIGSVITLLIRLTISVTLFMLHYQVRVYLLKLVLISLRLFCLDPALYLIEASNPVNSVFSLMSVYASTTTIFFLNVIIYQSDFTLLKIC